MEKFYIGCVVKMQTATCLEITCTIVIINKTKSKKKLLFFLDQGKWSSLKENTANNRENCAERFREKFCASYAGYLENLMERKQ